MYETDIDRLGVSIRGRVLLPYGTDQDSAREIWNRRFDGRPAVVVKCAGQADVRAAIHFARQHALDIAVRGDGHLAAGYRARKHCWNSWNHSPL